MTPFEIEMILHFNTSNGRYPREDAPIYPQTVKMFMAEGLIWNNDGTIQTTERGRVYCQMLTSTPLPGVVDPREPENPTFLRKIMD